MYGGLESVYNYQKLTLYPLFFLLITNYLVFIFTRCIFCAIVCVMKISKDLSDSEILIELGRRIKACRMRKEYTQDEFAAISGVSKGTVANAENGGSIQFGNLLKILRELDLLNALEVLLPTSEISPMELIQSKREKTRQRVRKSSNAQKQSSSSWKWGEDE